jgi:pyruvate/2-oxoglutarate/acetoin dehydrogenase E1 component
VVRRISFPPEGIESFKKTGRLVAVDEGYQRCGVGSEITAVLMRQMLFLKAPIRNISSPNCPVPVSGYLEEMYMITGNKIAQEIGHSMGKA